ncbi:hypothetical protein HPB50_016247 [Hyalomma asiaticum]|uniref:Uncharacterized protein n=1 Tax=Hyalomma asiaticum TaxID=266040 RepID=A0ACB7T7D4_HYAAI|nr:hypothetical protein HPB50_016247 [Hyalomma asiaticum]
MPKIENIIVASTADTERATRLKNITTIELGGTIFNVNAHVRHPDDVCGGVIYGLLPVNSSAAIVSGLRVNPRYTVFGARMIGRSSTAVITFDGPHVPYYITYQSGDYRCKPKECKKKLRPSPPPYQVRQQQLIKAKARECPWNPSCDEFPELKPAYRLGQPTARPAWLKQPNPAIAVQVSHKIPRISYADAAQGDSKSHHKHTLVSPAETTAVKALETGSGPTENATESSRQDPNQGAILPNSFARIVVIVVSEQPYPPRRDVPLAPDSTHGQTRAHPSLILKVSCENFKDRDSPLKHPHGVTSIRGTRAAHVHTERMDMPTRNKRRRRLFTLSGWYPL